MIIICLTFSLLLVSCSSKDIEPEIEETATTQAETIEEEKGYQTLGVPVKEGLRMNYCTGHDDKGKKNTLYMSYSQYDDTVLLVSYNIDTRESKQYNVSYDFGGVNLRAGAWGIVSGPDKAIYMGTYYGGRLLRFDPVTEEFIDLGQAIPGETYIWSLTTDNEDNIYGGTYPGGKMFRYNISEETFYDIGSFDKDSQYLRTIQWQNDGKVVGALGMVRAKVAVYDAVNDTKTVLDFHDSYSGAPGIFRDDDFNVYATLNGVKYSIKDEGLKLSYANPVQEEFDEGRKLIYIQDNKVTVRNTDGKPEKHEFTYQGAGAMLWMVHKGPDGLLYGSSALPLSMFSFDPADGKLTNLGNPSGVAGEIYSMANLDGRMYISAYPNCVVSVYDPGEDFDFGHTDRNNPMLIGPVGESQLRPYATITGPDSNIYIASHPDYGKNTGALSRLDTKTNKFEVFRGISGEQSVQALVSIEGTDYIVAGTSNAVGGGALPIEDEAKIFLFNTATDEVEDMIVPVEGAYGIQALITQGDIVFGVTNDATFFAYDYINKKILMTEKFHVSTVLDGGMAFIGKYIYGVGGEYLFRYDFSKGEFKHIAFVGGWSRGFAVDGRVIYGTAGRNLVRYILDEDE